MKETGKENLKPIRKITIAGMIGNIALGFIKITAGYFGKSQAVLADGVHSLSDLSTDIAVFIGADYWTAPPDSTHPHGHRRIETAISIFIGVILVIAAAGIGYNAVKSIIMKEGAAPDIIAFYAALISIILKEIIYRATIKIGRKINSSAVIANAWHHRTDSLSSIPAAAAVLAAILKPEWWFIDAAGAVLVTFFILRAAIKIILPAFNELTDKAAPRHIRGEIEDLCKSVQGVKNCHKCRTRKLGCGWEVDIHIQVEGKLSVTEGHEISGRVKHLLLEKGPDIVDVIIHIEPEEDRT
ncbi:MAG: cation diffusion facilitator family transporter [Candidatus Goldiibacteriota bacterium]